ncbi:RNA-binding protein [Archaeoglobales archaeon]|nr:MAG: RNA-binding protein [Archaeoglobales archaeon]
MKFVMPGDRLGYKEEFVAGEGVYEENGEIFAAVAGKLIVRDKVINVEPVKVIPEIERGDVVLGRVIDVRNSLALVELSRKKGLDRDLKNTGLAALHISNVQSEYLKDLNSAIRYMDIIKARVIDEKSLKLSTKEDEMGVVKSICSLCKHEMVREGNTLKCPNCGNVEKRKLSSDYGKGEW